MDYKEETKSLYEQYAREFEARSQPLLEQFLIEDANLFLQYLNGLDILDLGSGPGRDSRYFKDQGFNPLCIDFSKAMVELCKAKGLKAEVMDIEDLSFLDDNFNGVWANTSLLHIPKRNLPSIIQTIWRILKPEGIFYIGMKEGISEGYESPFQYSGKRRYNALYTPEELDKYISGFFRKIHCSRFTTRENKTYFNFLCIKKTPSEQG